jgi:NAD+ synthase
MAVPTLREGTEEVIEKFLSEKLRKTRLKGFVVGLSGGIDSAVVTRLCVRAVGREKVLALILPERDSPEQDIVDAVDFCENEGLEHRTIDITEPVDALARSVGGKVDRMALANMKARCRMIILYHHAKTGQRLVVGTSNKSEMLTGYFTKYGDGGADLEPIGDLYKTQVRQLAELIGVPSNLIAKTPSAGLWRGQTDEAEMGISYDALDSLLHCMELGLSEEETVSRSGETLEEVRRIEAAVRASSHKRKLPPVVKIGLRTPGLDWREGDEDL